MKNQPADGKKFATARRNYEQAEEQYEKLQELLALAVDLELEVQIDYLKSVIHDLEIDLEALAEELDIEAVAFFVGR